MSDGSVHIIFCRYYLVVIRYFKFETATLGAFTYFIVSQSKVTTYVTGKFTRLGPDVDVPSATPQDTVDHIKSMSVSGGQKYFINKIIFYLRKGEQTATLVFDTMSTCPSS